MYVSGGNELTECVRSYICLNQLPVVGVVLDDKR